MKVSELQNAYEQLRDGLLRGELDEREFKAGVENLRFVDHRGHRWKIGWYTSGWYRYVHGRWLQGKPQERPVRPGRALKAAGNPDGHVDHARWPVTYWLAAGLVGLLLVSGVVLVAGWNTDWWHRPAEGMASDARASPAAELEGGRMPMPSGRLFFPVYDPSPDRQTPDIYAVWLDSGKRELIARQASQPALSPNGERLAYRSWDSNRRGILVREMATGRTSLWIGYAEAARPSWSPDSQTLVFPSRQESDRQWRIYRTHGTECDRLLRLGSSIRGRLPVWLADGRIVYWECPLSRCGLYVMHQDGSGPTRLTSNKQDTAPAASPDGSQVAFMSNRNGNWEVYVVGSRTPPGYDGRGPKQLTHHAARDGLPAWSPNGRWLAFVTDRDGAWAIWAMQPDGSGQQRLLYLGGPLVGEVASAPLSEEAGWTWETLAWGP